MAQGRKWENAKLEGHSQTLKAALRKPLNDLQQNKKTGKKSAAAKREVMNQTQNDWVRAVEAQGEMKKGSGSNGGPRKTFHTQQVPGK